MTYVQQPERDVLVSGITCALPANGHTGIYMGRCELLSEPELQLLFAHLHNSTAFTRRSMAYVYPLGRIVQDTTCRQVKPSDHLAVIWRRGHPVTFFFTRTNQLRSDHLRVHDVLLSDYYLNGERIA